MDKHIHQVVVVGAGIAGLTAAHELTRAGFRDILVLEAQGYVGGRIKTSMDYGDPVELGAEFVQGKRIATWQYIDKINLPVVSVGGEPKLIDREGKELTARERQQYNALYDAVKANGKPGVSVAEITQAFRGDLSQKIVDLVNESIGDYEAGNADQLDSGAYTHMCQAIKDVGATYALPHGYRQLVDYLAARLRIQTSTVVRDIDLTNPECIEITLDTGERLFAHKVVVTVSLGVLKSRLIRFVPELSSQKRHVIQRLGMGRALKYILHFKTGELVRELFHMANGVNESLQTVTCWWQSASNHKVLVGYAGGNRHDKIVAMDEQTLRNKVMDDLEKIAGRPIRDELIGSTLVRWDTNQFVRGAYSNHPIGVSNSERTILAKPVDNRLFFAGEATVSSGNYATVDGAIESGQRVARQMQ